MSLDRLCSLVMLSIESLLARKLDFKDLIRDFASKKAGLLVSTAELLVRKAGLLVSKAEQGPVISVKWLWILDHYTHDAHRLRTRLRTRYIS